MVLIGLFILPFLGLLLVWLVSDVTRAKQVALLSSILSFLWSLGLFLFFDNSHSQFQFCFSHFLGVDGISLWFILLSAFLIPVCILVSWDSINVHQRAFLSCLLVIEVLLFAVFSVLDVLLFYVFYESVLIPMFFMIGVWGAREQKVRAAFYFFFYTLTGSVLMLLSILYVAQLVGSTNYLVWVYWPFDLDLQKYLFFCFFLSFAVKIPMIPFHIWLPLAHVEAPVAGSVLLAGILLKLGGYGFLRFLIPLFPEGCFYFSPLVFLLSVIAVVYGSLTTLRQVDVKRLIAYSSVAHMGLVTIGLVSMTTEGIIGALYLMIAHGVVSSALFISVTVLYDRFHTRIIKYYRGIVQVMPLFVVCFFVFILANMGTPLTANFVSEFLVLIGTFQVNTFIGFFASLGIVLSVAYNLYFFNRVSYGQLSLYLAGSSQGRDLSRREFFVLIPLVFLTFFLGICPAIMLETLSSCIQRVLV